MNKYYRNVVENIKTGERDTYVSERQGAHPDGWRHLGVCGYFEADGADLNWINRRSMTFFK